MTPYLFNAKIAYSEQVGLNKHERLFSSGAYFWYKWTIPIKKFLNSNMKTKIADIRKINKNVFSEFSFTWLIIKSVIILFQQNLTEQV